MIAIHCCIPSNIDDGPRTLADTNEMLNVAEVFEPFGIKHVLINEKVGDKNGMCISEFNKLIHMPFSIASIVYQ